MHSLRPTLYLWPDWGLAWTLQISTIRIVWFFQIWPKGFILRPSPNFNLSYVAPFWHQIFGLVWCNPDQLFFRPNSKLETEWATLLNHEYDYKPPDLGSNSFESGYHCIKWALRPLPTMAKGQETINFYQWNYKKPRVRSLDPSH